MNDEKKEPTIFISYTRPDSEWAKALAEHLEDEGARTWLPSRSVVADKSVVGEIQRGLRQSEFIVLILGREPDKSVPWVAFEWGAAIGTEKRAFVISPRGSNVDMGELPIYARTMSFYRKGDPAEAARHIKSKIDEVRGSN